MQQNQIKNPLTEADYIRYAVDNMRRTSGHPGTGKQSGTSARESRSSYEIAHYTKAIKELYNKINNDFDQAEDVRNFILDTARTVNAGKDLLRTDQSPEKDWCLLPHEIDEALNHFAQELLSRLNDSKNDPHTYDPIETVALIKYRLHRVGNFFKDGDHRISEALGTFVLMRYGRELPEYTDLSTLRHARPTSRPTTNDLQKDEQFARWLDAFRKQFHQQPQRSTAPASAPTDAWHVKEDDTVSHKSTIYDPENTVRTYEVINQLCKATGKEPYRVVLFRPGRMALLETIAAAVTRIQMEDTTNFLKKLIFENNGFFQQQILPSVLEVAQNFQDDVKVVEDYINIIMDDHFHIVNPNMEVRNILKYFRDIIVERIQKHNYDARLVESRTLLHYLVADEVIRSHYQKLVRDLVDEQITLYLKAHPDSALPLKPNHRRIAWVIVGGPASGKSQVENLLMLEHKLLGHPYFLCQVNPDLYKTLLLVKEPEDSEHGSKTRSEGLYLRELIVNRLEEMIKADNAPDFLITHQNLTKERMGLYITGGAKVNLYVVTCPVEGEEGAVSRAYKRAIDSENIDAFNRFISTESLLRGHRKASLNLPDALTSQADKQTDVIELHRKASPEPLDVTTKGNYSLRLSDTTTRTGALVAVMDSHNSTLRVLNPHYFTEFVKKSYINDNATASEAVYSSKLTHQEVAAAICKYPEARINLDFRYTKELPNPIQILFNNIPEDAANNQRILDFQPETYMWMGREHTAIYDFSTFMKAVGAQMAEALLLTLSNRKWPLSVYEYGGQVLLTVNAQGQVTSFQLSKEPEELTQEFEVLQRVKNILEPEDVQVDII